MSLKAFCHTSGARLRSGEGVRTWEPDLWGGGL
jgi:hypothetical protein